MPSTFTTTREAFVNGKSLMSCVINVEVQKIDVTSMTEPDPNWTFIDAAGHFHAYTKDFSLPTLKSVQVYVEVEPDDDDEGEEYGEYFYPEWRCRICAEVIVPGTRSTMGRKSMPGRRSWSAEVVGHTEDLKPLATELVSFWMAESPKVFGVGQLFANVTPVDDDGAYMQAVIRGVGELGSR